MPVTKHQYSKEKYDFVSILADPLTVDGVCFLREHDPKDINGVLKAQLSVVRNRVFEVLLGSAFQEMLTSFSQELASTHFDGKVYLQKAPSIRMSLPGTLGTSWHTDNWYGHGLGSQTFWVPLVNVVPGSGVSFVHDETLVVELESKLHSGELSLSDINGLCSKRGEEVICDLGEYLKFDSRVLHGSVGNSSDAFRCSFDFRGCLVESGVGNKPLTNYRMIEDSVVKTEVQSFSDGKAVKYISGATGASTKYQHILLEAYARENGIAIVRNEAEIESVPSRPVLGAYGQRAVPDADAYDHLLIYSMRTLPTDLAARKKLLDNCAAKNVSLHFVLEDLVFSNKLSSDDFLELADKYVVQTV